MFTALYFFKYISLVIGSISGVLALVLNTKNKETGRITKQGYILLVLIVVSGINALVMQTMEMNQNVAASRTNELRALKQLKKSDSILYQVNRAVTPFEVRKIAYSIQVPAEKSVVQEYCAHLKGKWDAVLDKYGVEGVRENSEDIERKYGYRISSWNSTGQVALIQILGNDIDSTDAGQCALYHLVHNIMCTSYFCSDTSRGVDSDLSIWGFTELGSLMNPNNHILEYDIEKNCLIISGFITINLDCVSGQGNMTSVLDLLGRKLILHVQSAGFISDINLSQQIRELEKSLKVQYVIFYLSSGQDLHVNGDNLLIISYQGLEHCFYCVFPTNFNRLIKENNSWWLSR